jgi:hypothetical protein
MLGLEQVVLDGDDFDSAAWHSFTLGQKPFGYLFKLKMVFYPVAVVLQ